MAESITCPMCQAEVELRGDALRALCADCHDMGEAELAAELQKRVDRALWVALRAVEDQAAFARWQQEAGRTVPSEYAPAEQAAGLLRRMLQSGA